MWMVRSGRGGENIEDFVKRGIVAFGGTKLGALQPGITKDDLLRLYFEKYPEEKEGSRAAWASQLMRLLGEVKIGDTVVTFDRDRRLYLVGTITSDYEWVPQIGNTPHIRRVKWTHEVPRDLLTVATRNSLGSALTLFKVGIDAAKDLRVNQLPLGATITKLPSEPKDLAPEEKAARDEVLAEMIEKADEFIEDALNKLDWQQMQELVAGILRSMGYRTTVSTAGSDLGVDIFASSDGLGLQEPRIFVEVKHRDRTKVGAEQIRAFLGGRKPGDKCLYVSTGSFTKEARYEAERASVSTTLLDLQDLRKLLVENYERLDSETRALVPLKRLYWPLTLA
jgi:restriction system protein